MKIVGKKNLSAAIKAAHLKINVEAEKARNADGETHAVMSAIYRMKYEEAKRVHSGSDEPTPLINAEAHLRGISRNRLANMIMDRHREWIERMCKIELKRIKAKQDVESLRDTREIEDFHSTVFGG